MLMVLVQSVIRRLPNSLSHREESMTRTCRCKWSLFQVRKGKYKGSMVGPRRNLGVERACFSSPSTFKTYTNLWEWQNQVIFINEQGAAWVVLSQVREVPEPAHGQSET
jgi:hypothetical protein